MSFGETVKNLRIAQKVTLRRFCQEHDYDPSNWSKIERGINPPPKDEETLTRWGKALGLQPETEAWKNFMLEAEVSRGNIPREVMNDPALLEKLPAFFRTVRGSEAGERELDNLIEKIRNAQTSSDEKMNQSIEKVKGHSVKQPKIQIPKKEIFEFCRRHHIRRLALFGSVLRDDFRPGSDVDVLVEFKPGHTPGLIRMAGMENELTDLLKRKVDLRTPAELSPYFRNEVLKDAEVQYDAAA